MVLRAIPRIGRLERERFMQAGEFLMHAIELEKDYAAGYAWLAYWQMFLVSQGWADDPASVMEEAGQHAERAVVLDPFDARGLTIAGHVRAFMHRRSREALTLHERALSLNPNLAMAWALSARAFAYAGDPEQAERRSKRYKQLSPHDPHAFFLDGSFILAHLLKRDHEAAVAAGREVSEMNPSFSATYKPYLAALGHLGRADEADGGAAAAAVDRAWLHRAALHRDVTARARQRPCSLCRGVATGRRAGACCDGTSLKAAPSCVSSQRLRSSPPP